MKYELIVDSGEGSRPDPIKEAIDALNRQGLYARLVEPGSEAHSEQLGAPMLEVKASVKLKTYTIVQEAVERGCQYGVRRACKHTDKPSLEQIAEECESAVMTALCEVIDFD